MNKISEKILKETGIENGAYLNAKNVDFAAFPEDIYWQIREKVAGLIRLDRPWDNYGLRTAVKSLNCEASVLLKGKPSAIFDWAKAMLKNIIEEVEQQELFATLLDGKIEEIRMQKENLGPLLKEIEEIIAGSTDLVSGTSIGKFLHEVSHSRRKEIEKNGDVMERIINLLQARIGDPAVEMDNRALSSCILALRSLRRVQVPEGYVDGIMDRIEEQKQRMDVCNVGMVFRGLANLRMELMDSRYLKIIAAKMIEAEEPVYFDNLIDVLAHFSRAKNKIIPPEFFLAVEKMLSQSNGVIGVSAFTDIIYHLRFYRSNEVSPGFIAEVFRKADREGRMVEREIGMCFYGLKNMNGKVVPVEMLEMLSGQLKGLGNDVGDRLIPMVFYGLQGFDAKTVPPELLEVLTQNVKNCRKKFGSQAFSCIFHGLKGSGDTLLNGDLLNVLLDKLEESDEQLDIRALDAIVSCIKKAGAQMVPPRFWQLIGKKIAEMSCVVDTVLIVFLLNMLRDADSTAVSRELMMELTRRLYHGIEKINSMQVNALLAGVRNLPAELVPPELLYVAAFRLEQCHAPVDNAFFCTMATNLKDLPPKSVPREFFLVLAKKISEAGTVDARSLGQFFFSLRNYDSSNIPPELIKVLTDKVLEVKDRLTLPTCCFLLHGLHGLSENLVPPELVKVLAEVIAESPEEATGALVPIAFGGLKNLGSGLVPQKLVRSLIEKLDRSSGQLKDCDVSSIFVGMQSLDGSVVKLEDMKVLTRKVVESKIIFSAAHVCGSLYGLQGLDGSTVPVELLEEFNVRLRESEDHLEERDICDALYGLQNIHNPAADKIRCFLMEKVEEQKELCRWGDGHIARIFQVLSLNGMTAPAWLVQKYRDFVDKQRFEVPKFNFEAKVFSVLKWVLPGKIIPNYYLDGFELDFYYPELKLNVEVDGREHDYKFRRDERRDKYLEKKAGIRVARFPVQEGSDMRSSLEELLKPFIEENNRRHNGGKK